MRCRTVNEGQPDENYVCEIVRDEASAEEEQLATQAAAHAVAELTVPPPAVRMSPMPSDNKWNALAVGLPLWFWWEHPGEVGTSVNQDDIQITMPAEVG